MTEFKKKVDSDWKKKAAQEKLLLAQKLDQKENQSQEGPKVTFSDVIRTFAMQAQMAIQASDPQTGRSRPDVNAIFMTTGMLEVIKEKTEGNLSPQESGMLNQILGELQMVSNRLRAAQQG